MVMIPEQTQATNHSQQMRKAYDAIPPSGKPFGSVPSGQQQYVPGYNPESGEGSIGKDEQRKLEIMRGNGYLRPDVPMPTLSGENIYLMNAAGEYIACRRCNVLPCIALRYIFEDEVRLKCTVCGKGMKMGLTEVGARESQIFVAGWDRAETNRKRLWRDQDAQHAEEIDRDFDQTAQDGNPFYNAMRDKQFVKEQFLG